jgi:hypothetical protein
LPYDQDRVRPDVVSAPPIRVDRILGAGPLCEIGQPLVAKLSSDRTVLVVGGDLGRLQWHGHDVSKGAERPYRLAVYDGRACRYLVPTRWPIRTIAFHPALSVVAIGTVHMTAATYTKANCSSLT